MKRKYLTNCLCFIFLSVIILLPILSTGMIFALNIVHPEHSSQALSTTTITTETTNEFNIAFESDPIFTDDSDLVDYYNLTTSLQNNNTEQNGTLYVLKLNEVMTFSDGISFVETIIISTIGFVILKIQFSTSPSKTENLRKRMKMQLLLSEAKTGLRKALQNTERYFRKLKQQSHDGDEFQYPLIYFALKGLPLYPRLMRLILLVNCYSGAYLN